MLSRRRADPYERSALRPDGKAEGEVMRDPPSGSIPRDTARPAFGGSWPTTDRGHSELEPPPITRELLASGRERFEDTCAACHGITGDGASVVATMMEYRRPPALHRRQSREQMFGVVTEGYGMMPSYAATLSARERWAVVAYVQALQLSRRVRVADLPPDVRAELLRAAP